MYAVFEEPAAVSNARSAELDIFTERQGVRDFETLCQEFEPHILEMPDGLREFSKLFPVP